jgi:hypothetical protein
MEEMRSKTVLIRASRRVPECITGSRCTPGLLPANFNAFWPLQDLMFRVSKGTRELARKLLPSRWETFGSGSHETDLSAGRPVSK